MLNEYMRILLMTDAVGIYIPQTWVNSCYASAQWTPCSNKGWIGLAKWARKALEAGPEHDEYWDAWCSALDSVKYISGDEMTIFYLAQDGDLWAVRDDYEWEDE